MNSLLKNLQFSLYTKSNLFWEDRCLYEVNPELQQVLDTAKQQAEALQKNPEKPAEENPVAQAEKITKELKQSLIDTVQTTQKATGVDANKLFNVVDQEIGKDFQANLDAQKFLTAMQDLIQHLETDLQDKTLDQDYDTASDYKEVLTQVERGRVTVGIRDALADKQNIDGFGEFQFNNQVLNKLFNSILEDKKDPNQTDGEFLTQQLQDKESPQSKIILEAYREIVANMEIKTEERPLIQELVNSLGQPYDKVAKNMNLQNVLGRRFNFGKINGEIVLVDQTKPDEKIAEPQTTMADFLQKEFPQIMNLTDENLPEELQTTLSSKDAMQQKGVEALKERIQDIDENKTEKFFDTLKEMFALIGEVFSGKFNLDKVEGMWMKLKIEKTESQDNHFNLTYKPGEKPKQATIFTMLKGKELTLNQETSQKQIVKITKKEQIQNITVVTDGKMTIEVKPVAEEKKVEPNDSGVIGEIKVA